VNLFLDPAPRYCGNPLCKFLLIGGARYCCGGCAAAAEGGYEVHEYGILGHSDTCARRTEAAPADTSVWFA
jgi:hypothetical protein